VAKSLWTRATLNSSNRTRNALIARLLLQLNDVKLMKRGRAKIQEWLQNSTDQMMVLTTLNPYQRRLIYQEVPKR
jgi:hypothetical protein